MDRDLLVKRTVEDDLRGAVAAGEIALYFQPIIDLDSGLTTGFEALARWLHPKRGMIAPAEFIGLAEHSGIIGVLGNFILAEACSQAAKWPSNLKVAVNLAPSQLTRPNFAMDIVAILAESGLAPHRLELEITESVRLVENRAVRKALDDLKTLGIAIALDDFGTGNSSLNYLRAFAFDKVKIFASSAISDKGRQLKLSSTLCSRSPAI
jgi:EAL domain-containing protein (putative c-di-GMP-specific phosphodiesterase class I)